MNMTHEITIRSANASDAISLANLSEQLGYPVTPAQITMRLEKIQQDHEHAVFVAELDGRIAGWVEVYARTILVDDGVTEIEGLVVDADGRGRGVGRALVAYSEDWACQHGCTHVYLRSNIIREAAHRFYISLGFQNVKTQKAFLKKL